MYLEQLEPFVEARVEEADQKCGPNSIPDEPEDSRLAQTLQEALVETRLNFFHSTAAMHPLLQQFLTSSVNINQSRQKPDAADAHPSTHTATQELPSVTVSNIIPEQNGTQAVLYLYENEWALCVSAGAGREAGGDGEECGGEEEVGREEVAVLKAERAERCVRRETEEKEDGVARMAANVLKSRVDGVVESFAPLCHPTHPSSRLQKGSIHLREEGRKRKKDESVGANKACRGVRMELGGPKCAYLHDHPCPLSFIRSAPPLHIAGVLIHLSVWIRMHYGLPTSPDGNLSLLSNTHTHSTRLMSVCHGQIN